MDESAIEREHGQYADWDAAYVFGSLSRGERDEYRGHLDRCKRCRSAVGELAPLPGLLSRVDADEALAILDEGPAPLPVPDVTRRRRDPWRFAASLAAAALVLVAVAVPIVVGHSPGHSALPPAARIVLSQNVSSPLTASVTLARTSWGTRVDMTCSYAAGYDGGNAAYGLYVVDRHGHASLVSSWRAGPGDIANTTGSSDLAPPEIGAVQVRDASGTVLLSGATS